MENAILAEEKKKLSKRWKTVLKNTQSITVIEAKKQISLYCPLGSDYYTANINIKFQPNQWYMDYIDLDKFLNKMSGMHLIIEEAVDVIYKRLRRYEPHKIKVTIEAFSNTHLDVVVSKGDDI